MKEPEIHDAEMLKEFYDEHLIPLAEKARELGVEIFPLGFDPDSESYFTDRKEGGSYVHTIDSDDLQGELVKIWTNDPIPGMAKIAGSLCEIARKLREKEEESDEVSPFLYAMF